MTYQHEKGRTIQPKFRSWARLTARPNGLKWSLDRAWPALAQAGSSPGGGSGTFPRKYFLSAYPRIRHQRSSGVN